MKKNTAAASVAAWLQNLIPGLTPPEPEPEPVPWHQRKAVGNVSWLALGLMLPFVLFLIERGLRLLLGSRTGATSDSGE